MRRRESSAGRRVVELDVEALWDGDGAWRRRDDGDARDAAAAAAGIEPAASTSDASADRCASLFAAAASARGVSRALASLERERRAAGGSIPAAAAAAAVATSCRDRAGRSLAHACAWRGDVDGVDALRRVAGAAFATRDRDAHGVAPLAIAAWRGHEKVVDLLLTLGADVNARDDFGVAAIHKAAGHGRVAALVRLLGDGAADVDLKVGEISDAIPAAYGARSRGQTALHVACAKAAAADETSDKTSDKVSSDKVSDKVSDPRIVGALLKYGADVAARDDAGNTPVHDACAACDVRAVRAMMSVVAKRGGGGERGDGRNRNARAAATAENDAGDVPGALVPFRRRGCDARAIWDALREGAASGGGGGGGGGDGDGDGDAKAK